MYRNLLLTPIAAALVSLTASHAYAAQAVNLRQSPLHPAAAVTQFNLKQVNKVTDKRQVTHVRMQQQYLGYDVIGGYAIFHKKPASAASTVRIKNPMNGIIYQGIQKDIGQPAQDLEKNGQQVLQEFVGKYAGMPISDQMVKPVVYIDKNHQAHWAYHVSASVKPANGRPEKPNAIIDAQSKKPFVQWDNIKHSSVKSVKGHGYGGNEKQGMFDYGGILPYLEITRDKETQTCFMENDNVKVVDMEHRYSSRNKPMKFECLKADKNPDGAWMTGYKGNGYDKENGAFGISNDAFYAGQVIKHMYRDWYDLDALTKSDGSPMQLVMRVHYGSSYENAFWDGEQMTFGDGEDMFYPLVSLGVGAHEISHGFTEQHSNLMYFDQSGGMNEAFSDMAAQAAEFYSVGRASWMIGAEIIKEDTGWEALRFMDVPSKDGRSIDTADEYYDGLDVHYSSGVYNRLFYLMANMPGWDVKKAFDVMVLANISYWTPYSSYEEGGCGVIDATNELGYSLEDVQNALNQVGIRADQCGGEK